jgi:uncharacterized protein (TIGR03084 family)
VTTLLDDLRAESEELDAMVAGLPPVGWAMATPAPGWTVAHQISHLAWTDRVALIAATDADGFDAVVEAALANPGGFVDEGAAEAVGEEPAALLTRWRDGRSALSAALVRVAPGVKLPWLGPPMSAASMATARLMETWAHAQDIADALGVARVPTVRLKQVAHLGVRTRTFGYLVHGLPAPVVDGRVELTAPDGQLWTWGPEDAPDRVTGPALDFCLLVTQRRHRSDLALQATGGADIWLDVAQVFAGPPGAGRPPGANAAASGDEDHA